MNELGLRGGHIRIDEDGWPFSYPLSEGRGYRDAYCRRTLDRETMPAGDYGETGWYYLDACPPIQLAQAPCTAPSPVTPNPQPTPAACPQLTSWGSGVLAARGGEKSCISEGRFKRCTISDSTTGVTIDSTAHFQGGAIACNGHHAPADEPCKGRICEDPRGGDWVWNSDGRCKVVANGFQLKCDDFSWLTWKVCPKTPAMDASGIRLDVAGDSCTEGEVRKGTVVGGCNLPPSTPSNADCKRTGPVFLAAVESSLDQLVVERPEIFDFSITKKLPCDNCYMVRDTNAFVSGVVANLTARSICVDGGDGEEFGLKTTNEWNEQWDLLIAEGFMRRREGAYRLTCRPSAF